MQPANQIRVLLADDHSILGQGLSMLLECEPDIAVVGHASNGKEAVDLFRQHQPDIMLIDLRMPEMNGADVIAAIRAEFVNARIIVLTIYDGDEDIYRALRAGAMGYLLKGIPLAELLIAIRTVYQGQPFFPAQIAAKLAQRMARPELSDRELDVLRLMAKGKTNPQIGAELSISESTVRFHINHILDKLGVKDRTQAVITAVNRGIVSL